LPTTACKRSGTMRLHPVGQGLLHHSQAACC
jgi:hypothetical protein